MTLQFQHATPAFRTFCGPDALSALPRELDRLRASRAVVFCDPAMLRYVDVLGRVESALGERLAGRFDGIREHSPVATVEAGRLSLEQAQADAVIVLGGGSAIVTARAATILLAEQRDVHELCTRREADGRLTSPRLLAPKLPQWIVPSTPITAYAKAGSAVRDPATGERLALYDPKTRAQGIFFDPAVALTAPMTLAQASALNAFAMAVEGLQSDVDDPLAEALLTHALRMLATLLPRARQRRTQTTSDAGRAAVRPGQRLRWRWTGAGVVACDRPAFVSLQRSRRGPAPPSRDALQRSGHRCAARSRSRRP
jgi:alcohol dehydrogenase class IV